MGEVKNGQMVLWIKEMLYWYQEYKRIEKSLTDSREKGLANYVAVWEEDKALTVSKLNRVRNFTGKGRPLSDSEAEQVLSIGEETGPLGVPEGDRLLAVWVNVKHMRVPEEQECKRIKGALEKAIECEIKARDLEVKFLKDPSSWAPSPRIPMLMKESERHLKDSVKHFGSLRKKYQI